MPKKELSIVIPTYNERKNISVLIPRIQKVLKKNKILAEIIVVDDYSPDKTYEVARLMNKQYNNVRLVLREKKEGIGAALRHGYNEAKGKIILSMDADLSFSEKDIPRFLEKINSGFDLVVGSRYIKKGGYEKKSASTFIKSLVSKFGNLFVRLLAGVPVHDVSANFRAIKRDVWKSIKTKEKTNSLLLEMIMRAHYSGYKVAEIPVYFKDRIYGYSKLNIMRESFKFVRKLLGFVWEMRVERKY